jgi:hypothetical protein
VKYDKNVFFFSNAVHEFGDIKEYCKTLMDICGSEEQLYTQLSEQIFIECKIIDEKFKSVHTAIKFFALSFIFVILILILAVIDL